MTTSLPSSVLVTNMNPDDRLVNQEYRNGVKGLLDNAGKLKSIPSDYVLQVPIAPASAPDESIPVVDLKGLDGTDEQRKAIVQAIGSACAEWGFFQIINHGFDASLMEEMMKVVEGFFCLPPEEKMKYASDDLMHPVRYGTSLNSSMKHTLYWRDYLRHFGHPIEYSYHQWPKNPPNYQQVAKEYLEDIRKLAIKIVGAISESLGLERDYVEKAFCEGCQTIANNYYPPCPEPHLTLGLVGHSDTGGITILMQNEVTGLQVKYKEKWIPIKAIPGTFIVNIADCLEIISNGIYKSIEHRAVVNEEKTRISIAVNFGPALTALVAPAASLVDENNGQNYSPIVFKDYMTRQQSNVVRGKIALKAIMKND